MVTKRYFFKKFVGILIFLVIILPLFGCLSRADEINCSDVNLNPEFLFGTWYLEEVALTNYIIGLETPEQVYVLPVDATEFLGYYIEFNPEFVQLKERTFYDPEYIIELSLEGWNFFSEMHSWEAGYYQTPYDLINEFKEQGLCVGHEVEDSTHPHFVTVSIHYPDPEFWRGVHVDLELVESGGMLMEFNPLLQHVTVLNDDTILIGNDTLILARRIE